MLGTRTRDGIIVGADKSTEQWRDLIWLNLTFCNLTFWNFVQKCSIELGQLVILEDYCVVNLDVISLNLACTENKRIVFKVAINSTYFWSVEAKLVIFLTICYPRPLFGFIFIFSNKHYNFTLNICEKCPSRIQCWDSNSPPSEHKSRPITTRPACYVLR